MNNDSISQKIKNENRFLYFAAICASITSITTIAIHHIPVPSGSFEENILLYKNKSYLALNWLILLHCLLVLISMLGMALVIEKKWRALAILGFLFFSLFVFSEWERTLGNLWHVNGLRSKYASTTDTTALQFLRYEIQFRLSQSNVQFLMFTLGFTLGNICNGLALSTTEKWDRWLGFALLVWGFCTACSFVVDFYPATWMGKIIDWCNRFYQPLIRMIISVWLWKKASQGNFGFGIK